MKRTQDFETWARQFKSLDVERWERAQQHALSRAKRERAEIFRQAIQWIIDRARKIADAALRPRPALGKPFAFHQPSIQR